MARYSGSSRSLARPFDEEAIGRLVLDLPASCWDANLPAEERLANLLRELASGDSHNEFRPVFDRLLQEASEFEGCLDDRMPVELTVEQVASAMQRGPLGYQSDRLTVAVPDPNGVDGCSYYRVTDVRFEEVGADNQAAPHSGVFLILGDEPIRR